MAYNVILSAIAQEELESSFLHIMYEFTNRYKIIYRISKDDVKVDGIYHNLQNLGERYKEDYLN